MWDVGFGSRGSPDDDECSQATGVGLLYSSSCERCTLSAEGRKSDLPSMVTSWARTCLRTILGASLDQPCDCPLWQSRRWSVVGAAAPTDGASTKCSVLVRLCHLPWSSLHIPLQHGPAPSPGPAQFLLSQHAVVYLAQIVLRHHRAGGTEAHRSQAAILGRVYPLRGPSSLREARRSNPTVVTRRRPEA